ncbi:putative lipooligosaccharide transport system, permease component (LptG family) [Campylobacter pinnipediorum subsp. pinnipediorum]|uniref:LptF/LptG family permease n=1 Tax=Campylobacter pinnipediorum TaxID=1965231 RepID=UPI00084DC74C|nr:LptF/LptG family permease [Campylobacter pinnipediorum]AQW81863.1 putative lipooligosaccharide transport system, permease component (LptG family) [Campylobacter pinnipediorum subsp. pinnipediorum]AQW85059.1 putative lipooligosaccharide transport system, permease component (LptG family) [Campylobacter pinnipediorum subsp. pinnipediorum]
MKLYSRYIGWIYFKTFLIIFLALELFYVGIDLLSNFKDLPVSAGLQLLYMGATFLTAISYTMPISLVLATVVCFIGIARSNEFVSFYALGVYKNSLIKMPFLISCVITVLYILLNFTSFAYMYDYQKSIKDGFSVKRNTTDSFLKFDGKFIYIKELNPLEQSISDIAIFDINNTTLNNIMFANNAKFNSDEWILNDTKTIVLPEKLQVGEKGLDIKTSSNVHSLKGFTPKNIQSANSDDRISLSVLDTIDFITTFQGEGASINNAKSIFYTLTIAPLFGPILVFILYYHLPVVGRFFNLALASFVYVLVTLIIWGVLFILAKFSATGVLVPELGIVMPVVLLAFYSIYLFRLNR